MDFGIPRSLTQEQNILQHLRTGANSLSPGALSQDGNNPMHSPCAASLLFPLPPPDTARKAPRTHPQHPGEPDYVSTLVPVPVSSCSLQMVAAPRPKSRASCPAHLPRFPLGLAPAEKSSDILQLQRATRSNGSLPRRRPQPEITRNLQRV